MKRPRQNHQLFFNVLHVLLSYKQDNRFVFRVSPVEYFLFTRSIFSFFCALSLDVPITNIGFPLEVLGLKWCRGSGGDLGLFGWREGGMTLAKGSLVLQFLHYHCRMWRGSVPFSC